MSPHRRRYLLTAIEQIRQFIEELPIEKSCDSCQHYKNFLCGLCNEMPPKEIADKGCAQWEEDQDTPPF